MKRPEDLQLKTSESLDGAKVLVTGGAGFVGSHLIDRLIQLGTEATIMDNLSTGNIKNINSEARFVKMDIRSSEAKKFVELEKPDFVIHCAAQKSVPKSVKNPYEDGDINVMGFLNLVGPCLEYKPKKFVFISTGGAIYGDAAPIPTPETYVPIAETPYAISKYTTEQYLSAFSNLYNLRYAIIRPANVYGPRQVPEGESGVVSIFLQNILRNQPSILFAYNDMPKGTTRDYVFVDDLVDAIVLASGHSNNDVFNVSSGEEVCMEDIYKMLLQISGKSLNLERRSERKGDVRRSALANIKAKEILGWTPKTSLQQGLKITYEAEEKDL